MTMTVSGGRVCAAHFSDWDRKTCKSTERLHVTVTDCRHPYNNTLDMTGVKAYAGIGFTSSVHDTTS